MNKIELEQWYRQELIAIPKGIPGNRADALLDSVNREYGLRVTEELDEQEDQTALNETPRYPSFIEELEASGATAEDMSENWRSKSLIDSASARDAKSLPQMYQRMREQSVEVSEDANAAILATQLGILLDAHISPAIGRHMIGESKRSFVDKESYQSLREKIFKAFSSESLDSETIDSIVYAVKDHYDSIVKVDEVDRTQEEVDQGYFVNHDSVNETIDRIIDILTKLTTETETEE